MPVPRHNAQAKFQRRERLLFVVAGVAERFVRKTGQRYLAEHGADAGAVRSLLILAAVLLPIMLDLLRHLVGGVGFEPVVDHFQNAASDFAQPILDGVLELPRRFRRDGLKQERPHELVDLLQLRLGRGLHFFANPLDILSNPTYQKSENRLRSCIEASFPGYVFVVQTRVFSQKTPLFMRPLSTIPCTKPTNHQKISVSLQFSLECRDSTL